MLRASRNKNRRENACVCVCVCMCKEERWKVCVWVWVWVCVYGREMKSVCVWLEMKIVCLMWERPLVIFRPSSFLFCHALDSKGANSLREKRGNSNRKKLSICPCNFLFKKRFLMFNFISFLFIKRPSLLS
jgi:hypothetical protein